MTKKQYAPGLPSWIDIGSPDIDGSAKFYGGLLDWTAEGNDDPATGGYRIFKRGGDVIGGLGPAQNPGPPHWTVYFATADADQTASKVKDAGGNVVMPPFEVMDLGRMAVLTDSVGAFFAIWEPKEVSGSDVWGETGSVGWVELSTRDIAKPKEFYGDVFGWTAQSDEFYTTFNLGQQPLAGMMAMNDQIPAEVPPHWKVYFKVDDIQASWDKALSLGATAVVGPTDIPGGMKFSLATDPQGAMFGLLQT